MSQTTFSQRLLNDLKANAAKTALLGVLFFVGLCFWVPPLWRAIAGNSAAAATPAAASAAATPLIPLSTTPTAATSPETSAAKITNAADLARRIEHSPLLKSASPEDMAARPFTVNDEQFPLPVLIAEDVDPSALASAADAAKVKPVDRLEGLTLKSTIVGSSRRAAFINNRLFQEGQNIPWQGKLLRLAAVQRKSVTLTDGEQEWQLGLSDVLNENRQRTESGVAP